MNGTHYDSASGTVTFAVGHFSNYVIGYDAVAGWKNPFKDVSKTAWYYKNVYFAYYTKGLFKGTSATTFAPDAAMTRAMFVTALGRLEGIKESDYATSSFTDVKANAWYSAFVQWAAKNNIVTGVGGGLFEPDKKITREEMSSIMYRYAMYKKYDVNKSGSLSAFSDTSSISDWASQGVKWAVGGGLINGIGDGTLAPKATATRAQVAAILQRIAENVVK